MEYTVNAGGNLTTIARDVLGNLTLRPEIAKINGLPAPYVIYPGQVIQILDPGTFQYGPAKLAIA